MRNSYLLQVPVILKHGALVADVPVITAVAAEGFGLRADEPRVHDLGKVVVGLAEVGQQLAVAVRLGVLCDRAADEMKAEAIGAAVGGLSRPSSCPATRPWPDAPPASC